MLAHLCAHPWSNTSKSRVKRLSLNENRNDNSKKLSESSKVDNGRLKTMKGNGEIKKSENKTSIVKTRENQPDLIQSVTRKKAIENNECFCKDFETFLSKSSIQEPGNVPMVVIRDVVLRSTGAFERKDFVLAMGNVVNGIHKTSDWIYVQTAQGNDGYIPYNSCLPLGIRPPTRHKGSAQLAAPWEINNGIIKKTNQTDIEKLEISNETEIVNEKKNVYIMVVCDYISKNRKQMSVRRGQRVRMIETNNNDWIKVKTLDGLEGLIPIAYTNIGKQLFF